MVVVLCIGIVWVGEILQAVVIPKTACFTACCGRTSGKPDNLTMITHVNARAICATLIDKLRRVFENVSVLRHETKNVDN